MSRHTIHTPFQSGDLITERAARRVTAHPRAAAHQPTPTSTLASAPRILRRWSVAELIARAAARPPVLA